MGKGRLEAFSDAVIAIIITIMVLELKVPHGEGGAELHALKPLFPVFICYILSFIYLGIYWNNHHHLLHAVKSVNGNVLWANSYFLFWQSLIPFATSWMGENHFSRWPVAAYGVVLLMNAIAYTVLARTLISYNGTDSTIGKALGRDFKGKISVAIYILAILAAVAGYSWLSFAAYILVALIWLIPDKRIEREVAG
jgi:uncharacterized membrane protein